MKRVFCPHCSQQVQQKTYQEHRRLYFDESNQRWKQPVDTATIPSSSESSDTSSQCSEPSSVDILKDDPYQHVQVSPPSSMDKEIESISESSMAEASLGSTGHNSDQGSSTSEED